MLIRFLEEEMEKRNLSGAELSRRAGLAPNAISSIINGTKPGLKACLGLSLLLGVPIDQFLYMAGHIEKPSSAHEYLEQQAVDAFRRLPPDRRDIALKMMRALIE